MLNAYTHFKREEIQNINTPYTVSFCFVLFFQFLPNCFDMHAPPPNNTNKLTNKQNNQTNKKVKEKNQNNRQPKYLMNSPPIKSKKQKTIQNKQTT